MSPTADGPEAAGRGPDGQKGSSAANWGIAFDLGLRLGVAVLLGLGIGLLADNWLNTNGLLILVGLLVGAAAAMYTIWDVARDAMRR
ncbi:MAG TPA: AtpZ/AtpI family protein [Candidatus Limnocylindria bacterium]|nr:AtpZ/AtpI family protein [Candidatus Limnocylindria bacterium]